MGLVVALQPRRRAFAIPVEQAVFLIQRPVVAPDAIFDQFELIARLAAKRLRPLKARNPVHWPRELFARVTAIDDPWAIDAIDAGKIAIAIGIRGPLVPIVRQEIAIIVDITRVVAKIGRVLRR